jgi:predicted enzyme related to lactoylglutathione lyase
MASEFFQVQLRTLDVEAANVFYSAVLGAAPLRTVPLHEQAIARGARPHWLGYLRVADVERSAEAFLARGAQSLGPIWVNPEGLEAAIMRDPGGAIVALAKPPAQAESRDLTCRARSGVEVGHYVLHTTDVERAKVNYGELCGWAFGASFDLAPFGVFYPFGWERGGEPAGVLNDIAQRPSVHAHWLYHFRVPALEPALAAVRAAGGLVVGPFTLPDGQHVAACDDPQGAAFGLIARTA